MDILQKFFFHDKLVALSSIMTPSLSRSVVYSVVIGDFCQSVTRVFCDSLPCIVLWNNEFRMENVATCVDLDGAYYKSDKVNLDKETLLYFLLFTNSQYFFDSICYHIFGFPVFYECQFDLNRQK